MQTQKKSSKCSFKQNSFGSLGSSFDYRHSLSNSLFLLIRETEKLSVDSGRQKFTLRIQLGRSRLCSWVARHLVHVVASVVHIQQNIEFDAIKFSK